jgi:hypothetical protein
MRNVEVLVHHDSNVPRAAKAGRTVDIARGAANLDRLDHLLSTGSLLIEPLLENNNMIASNSGLILLTDCSPVKK